MMRARLSGLAALAFGAMLCVSLLSGCDDTTVTEHKSTPEQIAKGRYLAKAADCAACHTAQGGAPFAGGVELESPFGTFYGTNISPDPTYGIGKWTSEQFYRVMHYGVSPTQHLYPSMPYTSYRSMTREDSDAIFAYLMASKPAPVPDRKPSLRFPFNLRPAVIGWNLLFLHDTLPDASTGQSADWLRGRYLANALGHCAECHTQRGAFGQMDGAKPLQGSTLGRVAPPDITPAALAARGWNAADLQQFFATGVSRQGSAYGEMHPVIVLSTQYLSADDQRALSTYLLGDVPPKPAPAVTADASAQAAGQKVYLGVCAGCHGLMGEGRPHGAVPMQGNSTLRLADSRNLIVAMLDGIKAADFPGTEKMQDMPGFAKTLSDEDVAQLANYLRVQWGGQAGDVTPAMVKALR